MSTQTMNRSASRSWTSRLSERTPRRVLVGIWALCCVGFLAFGVFEVKGAVWFALFAVAFAADITLFVATQRVADRPTSNLDERERAIRNDAYRSSYLLVFFGILVAVGGAIVLFTTGNQLAPQILAHPASHPAFLIGFGVAALQLVSLLPTSLIAWTEGDLPIGFD